MRKYIKIVLSIILVILVLFLILIFTAPKLINLESFKTAIIKKLEQETGGDFTVGKVDLSFFPTINIIINNLSYEIENGNKYSGTLDSISIYPKLIQLINNKIEIKEIVINSPRVTVEIKDSPDTKTIKEKVELTLLEILQHKVKKFASLSSKFKGIILEINNGSLSLKKMNILF